MCFTFYCDCIITKLIFPVDSHADEFFRDVQSDLRKRSASRSATPNSLWEELAVRAVFILCTVFIMWVTHMSTIMLICFLVNFEKGDSQQLLNNLRNQQAVYTVAYEYNYLNESVGLKCFISLVI